jgi:hypothetical protein
VERELGLDRSLGGDRGCGARHPDRQVRPDLGSNHGAPIRTTPARGQPPGGGVIFDQALGACQSAHPPQELQEWQGLG